jgi:hypothetical protein
MIDTRHHRRGADGIPGSDADASRAPGGASDPDPSPPGDPEIEAPPLPDLGLLHPNAPVELVFRYAGGGPVATARTFYVPRIHELVDLPDPELEIYGTVVDVVWRDGELEIVLVQGEPHGATT